MALAGGQGLAFGVVGFAMLPRRRPLHGDARFATRREIARAGLLGEHGIILGRLGNRYLVLGTVEPDGRPRLSPVYFVPAGYDRLYWVSSPDAQHSRNVRERPEVQIVVFDSSRAPGDGEATTGSPTDGSVPSTITNTTTNKSLLPAVGAVSINAKASQGAKDIVIGGAAGAGAGVGTVIVNIFGATTSASLDGGSLHANSLSVVADSKSGYNALTTSASFGASSAAFA